MTHSSSKIDLSDIDLRHLRNDYVPDNNEESIQKRLDDFLDAGLPWERLEILLSDKHRQFLIKQINESVTGDVLGILSLGNQARLQNQRENAADLIRLADLFKKLLSDASVIRKSEWELRTKLNKLLEDFDSLQKDFLDLERSSIEEKKLKDNLELQISVLKDQLEAEKKVSSDLMEEDVVTKMNAKKIQDRSKQLLKQKQIVSLKDFLDSREWQKLLKERVSQETLSDKKEIWRLNKKIDNLAQRVIDVEDTNTFYKSLTSRKDLEFDQLRKFSEELIATLPTNKEVNDLKDKINSLIIEKSELSIRLSKAQEESIWDRVNWVEETVEDLKKRMEEMEKAHKKALEEKDDEISRIKRANNIWVAPHIMKKANDAYKEHSEK